jgi:hypothetical protein
MNHRVSSVSHGLSGTKRESLILKGFLQHEMRHEFSENRTRIPLILLAVPAGFEPATRGVEIRHLGHNQPELDITLPNEKPDLSA